MSSAQAPGSSSEPVCVKELPAASLLHAQPLKQGCFRGTILFVSAAGRFMMTGFSWGPRGQVIFVGSQKWVNTMKWFGVCASWEKKRVKRKKSVSDSYIYIHRRNMMKTEQNARPLFFEWRKWVVCFLCLFVCLFVSSKTDAYLCPALDKVWRFLCW